MAIVTFIGGEECGDVGSTIWSHRMLHGAELRFPLNAPVEIDPESVQGDMRQFYERVIRKALSNRYFRVTEGAVPAKIDGRSKEARALKAALDGTHDPNS